MANSHHDHDFFIPGNSFWPPFICLGVGLLMFSLIGVLHPKDFGLHASVPVMAMVVGLLIIVSGMVAWFGTLIEESRARKGNVPLVLELANRYGMVFFIVSEVMFFSAFFAALFYLRLFNPVWPPENIPHIDVHLPILGTLILLTSGATITWAHHAMLEGDRREAHNALFLTWLLGATFLLFQVYEYTHLIVDEQFTFSSGIAGSTFFMLTGFHGFHVFVGTIMLIVAHLRLRQGDFTPTHHFYFEATAWYWHFVDVVWVGLFLFVYVL